MFCLQPHVERLLTQSDRACQSTAAEILAGALRIAHKNNAEADPAWAQSAEWISSSVMSGVLGAPPECIVDWMVCHCPRSFLTGSSRSFIRPTILLLYSLR